MKADGFKRMVGIFVVLLFPIIMLLIFYPRNVKKVRYPKEQFPTGVEERKDDYTGKVKYDTTYYVLPEFNYQNQYGDSTGSQDLRGSVYIANFFFSNCPGICPIMNKSMMRIQKEFGLDNEVKLVSFSIDPDRDSLERLRSYSQQYKAVPGKWFFLRGNEKQMQEMAEKNFKVTSKRGEVPGSFDHSEKLIMVDHEGHIRGYYDGTDSAEVSQLMADMVLLISRMRKRKD